MKNKESTDIYCRKHLTPPTHKIGIQYVSTEWRLIDSLRLALVLSVGRRRNNVFLFMPSHFICTAAYLLLASCCLRHGRCPARVLGWGARTHARYECRRTA